MEILLALIIMIAFSCAFANAIKKHPSVFYVIAIALDLVFVAHVLLDVSPIAGRIVEPYFQRCLLAFGLFFIVMMLGALPDRNLLRKRLMSIRGELSVIAAILTLGHAANYFSSYFSAILTGFAGIKPTVAISILVSFVLLLVLALLTLTSFNVIRKQMNAVCWKRLQQFSYLFFALTFVHLAIILVPSALFSFESTLPNMLIYAILFAVYTVMRIAKAVREGGGAN